MPTKPASSQLRLNLMSSYCSIAGFLGTGYGVIYNIVYTSNGLLSPTGMVRLYTLLVCGILASIIYGILWVIFDVKIFKWNFGAGGGKELPDGFSALVLSSTMIIGLIIAPVLYGYIVSVQIVPSHHLEASLAILFFGAIGHLVIYGSKKLGFRGIRNFLFPKIIYASFWKGILMEFIYTFIHFCSIALPYRVITQSSVGHLWNLLLPAFLFFFGITFFLVLKYPESLHQKMWVTVRGFFSAFILAILLQFGMLM